MTIIRLFYMYINLRERQKNSGVEVRVLVGSKFSLFHVVHTGSEAHPTSHPMGIEVFFPAGKAAEV
jgi:hypothetical protein